MAQRQWRSDDTDSWIYGFGDGSDGDLTISSNTTEAPIDSSCSGTSGTTSLSATNASFASGQLILIHQTRGTGVGAWELNKIASYTTGAITLEHNLTNTYTDSGASQAQVRVLKQYNNVTINTGVTYSSKQWNQNIGGIIGWFAKGTTTVTGNIYANGENGSLNTPGTGAGFYGGEDRAGSDNIDAYQGEGSAGAGGISNNANGSGGGAGSKDVTYNGTGAGGGGHASAGINGTDIGPSKGGTGGSAVGNASLTSLNFGGGGGGGADSSGGPGAAGASGAGIVCIFSKELTISGSIQVNGGAGQTEGVAAGPSGGGAGGSVLLKSQIATLGTNKITATGGAGGVGTGGSSNAGAGSVGRIHIDYSTSYTGTTTPTIDATLDTTIKPISSTGNFLAFM